MQIVAVDPADDPAFAAWFEAFEASQQERWPGRPGWLIEELRAQALGRAGLVDMVVLAAVDGGSVIGAGCVEIPVADNRHLAQVTLEVRPDRRRRGIGSALLAALESVARAESRPVVIGEQSQAVGAVEPVPGRAFALRHGYQPVLEEVRRDLDVPVAPGRLAAVEAVALAHAAGYVVSTFQGRWPARYLDDRALFGRRMSTDPPSGALDRVEERWERDRVRQTEELVAAMGRALLVATAVDTATGRPVAFSEITVPRRQPEVAYQWDTLVLDQHRGHRLGTLLKVANLRQLAAAFPETRSVSTWNARDNGPMIAVNEALGCVVTGAQTEWQKRIA